jgi:hypothetical protein
VHPIINWVFELHLRSGAFRAEYAEVGREWGFGPDLKERRLFEDGELAEAGRSQGGISQEQ